MDYFNNIPNALLITISEYLEPSDLLNLELLNKNINYKVTHNEDLILSLLYMYSQKPKIVICHSKSYNYQWDKYTLSICSDKQDLKKKYIMAQDSYNRHYLKKNN